MKFSFVRSLWNHLRFHVRAGKKRKPASERAPLSFAGETFAERSLSKDQTRDTAAYFIRIAETHRQDSRERLAKLPDNRSFPIAASIDRQRFIFTRAVPAGDAALEMLDPDVGMPMPEVAREDGLMFAGVTASSQGA